MLPVFSFPTVRYGIEILLFSLGAGWWRRVRYMERAGSTDPALSLNERAPCAAFLVPFCLELPYFFLQVHSCFLVVVTCVRPSPPHKKRQRGGRTLRLPISI